MDFGIARSMEAVTRLTGSMVGTPAYMAPEQVAGKPVDYRTDIYSLGLMMYEVFTGAQAFRADNAVAVALKQMRESPVPPHEIEPAVPVGVERAILKCLEKEPAKRFQSIGELESAMRTSGAPAAQPTPAVTPNYFNRAADPPALLYAAPAEPKRTSPVTWVLLGALLVIGAFAGWHSLQVIQAAENLPPPAAGPAPAPPDFALDFTAPKPAASSPATAEPAASETADAKAEPDKPEEANPETPAPVKQAPAPAVAAHEISPAKNQTSPQAAAPRDAQRAEKAFGETEPVARPPVNDNTPSYLWVGRFEQEEKAQSTAKKIEDLGLSVVVVPRRGLTGEFYVVLAGPYGPERIESAMDWLKTQGFANVRLVKNPLGNQHQTPN
jgi:Protein kinase domain